MCCSHEQIQTNDLNNLIHFCLSLSCHTASFTVLKKVFKDSYSGFIALTKLQPITWKLPSGAVVLKKIILLLQGTLVRVNNNGRTHLVVCWLLKYLMTNLIISICISTTSAGLIDSTMCTSTLCSPKLHFT